MKHTSTMSPEERLRHEGAIIQDAPRVFGTLRLRLLDEVLSAPPRTYILKGLFSPGELSVVWGAPKCARASW